MKKVLLIYNKFPYPVIDGGAIASDSLTRTLLQLGIHMDLFTFSTQKHPADSALLPKDIAGLVKLHICPVNTEVTAWKVIRNLSRNTPIHADRIRTKEAISQIVAVLKNTEYDFVILDGLFALAFWDIIKDHSSAKIVYRAHNVEHQVWALRTQSTRNLLKKWYFQLLAKRLKAFERRAWSNFHQIWAITENDKRKIQENGIGTSIYVLPVGMRISGNQVEKSFEPRLDTLHFFHLGAMDWSPNVEAMEFYIRKVHPILKKWGKSYYFTMAGRHMPSHLLQLHDENLEVMGEVESLWSLSAGKSAFVVPLLSGSGIRIKILEAMSLGIPVISSSVGASGISYTDGENILIANSADDYVKIAQLILSGQIDLKAIGTAGQILVRENYRMEKVSDKLRNLLGF